MQTRATSLEPIEGSYDEKSVHRTGLVTGLGRRLRAAIAGYAFWRRCAKDIRHLEDLDERMLADLGLSRHDIERRVLRG